jgi:hypothetical protein
MSSSPRRHPFDLCIGRPLDDDGPHGTQSIEAPRCVRSEARSIAGDDDDRLRVSFSIGASRRVRWLGRRIRPGSALALVRDKKEIEQPGWSSAEGEQLRTRGANHGG